MSPDQSHFNDIMYCLIVQRLKRYYYQQITSREPSLAVIFHCAVGLAQTEEDQLACDILDDLIEQGYNVNQCRLELAKCQYQNGYMVKARRTLDTLLADAPNNQEANQLDAEMRQSVNRNGKIALYTVGAVVLGCVAAFFFYRRNQSSSNGSTPYSAVHSSKPVTVPSISSNPANASSISAAQSVPHVSQGGLLRPANHPQVMQLEMKPAAANVATNSIGATQPL